MTASIKDSDCYFKEREVPVKAWDPFCLKYSKQPDSVYKSTNFPTITNFGLIHINSWVVGVEVNISREVRQRSGMWWWETTRLSDSETGSPLTSASVQNRSSDRKWSKKLLVLANRDGTKHWRTFLSLGFFGGTKRQKKFNSEFFMLLVFGRFLCWIFF